MSKLALCIGINAYGGDNTLAGCVNDANDWAAVLIARGYAVTRLLDKAATLDGIVDAIAALTTKSRYRDRLVITYSGHGTYGPDLSGDEADHRDEAICPVDCFSQGMLYDDELKNLMARRAWGSRLFFFSDSCHSGSVSRLLGTDHLAGLGAKARFLPPYDLPARTREIQPTARAFAGTPALLMSGCSDTQYSYDASFHGRPNGAATYYALNTLASNPSTYAAWQKLVRAKLPSDSYPQSPQLLGALWRKYQSVL